MELEYKTIEEMHAMTKTELQAYESLVWKHYMDISTIKKYIDRIGHTKLLGAPVIDVEFEEEEEE